MIIEHRQCIVLICALACTVGGASSSHGEEFIWTPLAQLPNDLGVAGPFAGAHGNALLIAGGANFPRPVWETNKVWCDDVFVLERDGEQLRWRAGGTLQRPLGYGAAVSTQDGVLCIGGSDAEQAYADVFLLRWDHETKQLVHNACPALPSPFTNGQAVLIDNKVFVAGGQSGTDLKTAMQNLWVLNLSQKNQPEFGWQVLTGCPGLSRALNLTVAQSNGSETCLYVMGGRRMEGKDVQFLNDVWEYSPKSGTWRERAPMPTPNMAGTGIGIAGHRIAVLGGDDGKLFTRTDELKDRHPGFPKTIWTYSTIEDRWFAAGEMPQNHVTTIPVEWEGEIVIASGEVRPRVRSPQIWKVSFEEAEIPNP